MASIMNAPLKTVEDYNALESLEKSEGLEVLVLYSNLIYRVIQNQWTPVGSARSLPRKKT